MLTHTVNAAQVIKSMLWPSNTTFEPTGTISSHTNERSSRDRQPRLNRLVNPIISSYIIYVMIAIASLTSFFFKVVSSRRHNNMLAFSFYTASIIIQIQIVLQLLLPIRYMIWPPNAPERKDLMLQDDAGVCRPKVDYRDLGGVKLPSKSARKTVLGYSHVEIAYLSAILFVGWLGL
jgi:hypothetical protein